MEREDFERAASYWDCKEAARSDSEVMPREDLRVEINRFLREHNTCALATGAGDYVRCTPLEYLWEDGAFWIFSEGGRKFVGLERNANVSLAVFEPYEGFGRLASMQVMGKAEVVDPASPEFTRALGYRGIPASKADKIAQMLHVIKVTPVEADYLCSALKEKGYDFRQHLVW